MIALVREVRRKVRTVLLTNNVAEFDSLWRPIIPVQELFDRVIDSSAVGLRKPDPRIFRLALEAALVAPPEAFFVDDTLENVLAAERLGIRSIHFSDERESATIEQIRGLVFGGTQSLEATPKG
jgi:epoxide hydrolase-like predicted phosphatase